MTDPFDALRRYAHHLESEVSPGVAEARVRRAMAEPAGARRPRRLVVTAATAGLLAISNVAMAAVADPAAPGDTLYGVDRAYERLAGLIADGNHAVERIDEAEVVAERGDRVEALSLVREALDEIAATGNTAAVDELLAVVGRDDIDLDQILAAARRAAETAADPALREAAAAAGTGLSIAEVAQHIRSGGPLPPPANVPDAGVGPAPPDDPGQPEDTGKPDAPGQPEDSGKPDDPGRPDDPSDDAGPPQEPAEDTAEDTGGPGRSDDRPGKPAGNPADS